MRGFAIGVAASILALTSSDALAERQLLAYHEPDAGTLVVSFATTTGREVGCLVERLDLNGSDEFTSQPTRSQHDFTDHFDSASFVKAEGFPGYESDDSDYSGKVELIKLPPGKYHFLSCSANYGVFYTPFSTSTKPPDITFEIETAKATYVGAYRYVALEAKGIFGAKVIKGYLVHRSSEADRDLGTANSVGVNVTEPIMVP